MANLLIMRPLPMAAVWQGGAAAPNLLTPDPKEVIADPGGGVPYYVDFGSAVTLDSFFVGYFAPISAGGYLESIGTTTAMNDTGHVVRVVGGAPLAVIGRRRSAFLRMPAPATSRYWRLGINGSAQTLGIVAGGLAIQPAWGHEWGSGRQPIDMSRVEPLRGGGFGIERGARMSAWRFTCGDLTDAETQSLWAMAEEVGESSPVVVCEDPDYTAGLNERLHYGLFDSPEAYEREIPGASRWSFRVREWV